MSQNITVYAVIGYVDDNESRPNSEIIAEFNTLEDAQAYIKKLPKDPHSAVMIANEWGIENAGEDPQYYHPTSIVRIETIEVLA
ncbi:MAG: hypothetical protein WCW93_03795 [Candidatus Paceibacterota bacterium]